MALHERRTLFRRLAEDPVAAAVAVLLGAATAGLLIYAFLLRDAGDEPPIRVRHGTVILEVVHKRHKWTGPPEGPWKLTGGDRDSNALQLYLAPTDPARCGNVQQRRGNVVRLTLRSDPDNPSVTRWIFIQSVNQHIQVTVQGVTGSLSPDKKLLSFGSGTDFLGDVTIDNQSQCTFGAKDDGVHVLVTE